MDEEGNHSARAAKSRAAIEWAFDQLDCCNLPGIKGTRWAAYNAVTAWADHAQGTQVRSQEGAVMTAAQKDERRAENRLTSIWNGSSAYLKNLAFQLLGSDGPLTLDMRPQEKVKVRNNAAGKSAAKAMQQVQS